MKSYNILSITQSQSQNPTKQDSQYTLKDVLNELIPSCDFATAFVANCSKLTGMPSVSHSLLIHFFPSFFLGGPKLQQ